MCVGYTRPGRGYATVCETYDFIMTNLQQIDLHDIAQYWKSRGLVAERHLPYYVRWLQRVLAGPGGDPSLALGDAQRAFVEQLEREQIPEWHTTIHPSPATPKKKGSFPEAGIMDLLVCPVAP